MDTGDVPTLTGGRPTVIRCLVLITVSCPTPTGDGPVAIRCPVLTTGGLSDGHRLSRFDRRDVPMDASYQPG